MKDTPTPLFIIENVSYENQEGDKDYADMVLFDDYRKLERELSAVTKAHDVVVQAFRKTDDELTAVTEQLKETKKHLKDAKRGDEINAHALRISTNKLIKVTEQRDRLAEALENTNKDIRMYLDWAKQNGKTNSELIRIGKSISESLQILSVKN